MTVRRDPYKNASNRSSPPGKLENEDKNNQNLYVPPPSRKDEKNNLVRAEEMLENGAPPRPPLPREEGRRSVCRVSSDVPNSSLTRFYYHLIDSFYLRYLLLLNIIIYESKRFLFSAGCQTGIERTPRTGTDFINAEHATLLVR